MSQAFDKFITANQLLLTRCSKETLALAWNAGVEASAKLFYSGMPANLEAKHKAERIRGLKVSK